MFIYKIISKQAWQQWQEHHTNDTSYLWYGEGIDLQDQYIHCSQQEQVAQTLTIYFKERQNLFLLSLKAENKAFNLQWELSRNNDRFPHLYGGINLQEVDHTYALHLNSHALHILPWSPILTENQ